MRPFVLGILLATSPLFGCDQEKKGESTFAQLAVANSTAASTSLVQDQSVFTPSVFELKLIDVRILTGLDTTTNPAPIIWYNPECNTATVSETEVDGKTYEYTQSPGCDVNQVTKYFDFARATAAVNADLNSQPNKVYPATYKYVSLSWCQGGSPKDNVRFQADGMTEPFAGASGGCGTMSAEAIPPLVVAEGETVTISLDYSIKDIVSGKSGEICWTSSDGTKSRCLKMPVMTPSAKKA